MTPHASFLALTVTPEEAYANIVALRSGYDVYGPHGFYDSVNPITAPSRTATSCSTSR